MLRGVVLGLFMTLLFPTRLSIEPHIPEVQVQESQIQEPVVTQEIKVEEVPKRQERQYINVELTGYCNDYACTQNTKAKGKTASGVMASRGTIAVPKQVPFGTPIYINGKRYRAEDRGGAIKIKSNGTWVFDVWFPTHQQALDFGRVKARMYEENGQYFIEY